MSRNFPANKVIANYNCLSFIHSEGKFAWSVMATFVYKQFRMKLIINFCFREDRIANCRYDKFPLLTSYTPTLCLVNCRLVYL